MHETFVKSINLVEQTIVYSQDIFGFYNLKIMLRVRSNYIIWNMFTTKKTHKSCVFLNFIGFLNFKKGFFLTKKKTIWIFYGITFIRWYEIVDEENESWLMNQSKFFIFNLRKNDKNDSYILIWDYLFLLKIN